MNTKSKSAIFAAGIVGTVLLGTSGSHAQGNISGRWIGSDNSVLVIRGSEWTHPARGTATIRKGRTGGIDVFYHQYQGMKCSYRVHTAAGGEILVLEPSDALQSFEFCPSGRFSRRD